MTRARANPSDRSGRCLRALLNGVALCTLLAVMPGGPQVVRELVSVLALDDCCEHACDAEDCCPGQCLDCRYCAHTSALAPPATALALTGVITLPQLAGPADLHPFAYVSPPARPPSHVS